MTDCQVLDSKLFSRLPDAIIFEICVLTGKFKLRFDKRFNRIILVSIIDLNDKLWIEFNTIFALLYRKKLNITNGGADFGRRVTCSISRNGDLCTRMYLNITLPTLPTWQEVRDQQLIERASRLTDHSEFPAITNAVIPNQQSSSSNLNNKRRRGEKKRFKMQFK